MAVLQPDYEHNLCDCGAVKCKKAARCRRCYAAGREIPRFPKGKNQCRCGRLKDVRSAACSDCRRKDRKERAADRANASIFGKPTASVRIFVRDREGQPNSQAHIVPVIPNRLRREVRHIAERGFFYKAQPDAETVFIPASRICEIRFREG
jgi:hypothetical protein